MTTGIYGPTPGESLARYVQGSDSYWKMSQVSFLGLMDGQVTPDEFSETWPKSGLMLGGIVYPRHQRALRISDSDGGLSGWATPKSQDAKHPGISPAQENRHGPDLTTQVVQWPTPTSSDHKAVSPYGQVSLGNHPDIFGTTDRPKGQKSTAGDGINTKTWSTPTARDYKDGTADAARNTPENGLLGRTIHRGQNQPKAALNPDWVEWLMAVPEGWTNVLEPIDPSAYATWFDDMSAGRWWLTERDIPRVVVGMKKRVDRLKALGNGIVPAALARFLTYDD